LEVHEAPSDEYSCDRCQNRVHNGAALMSCRQCDFDICKACSSSDSSSIDIQEVSDWFNELGDSVREVLQAPLNGGGRPMTAWRRLPRGARVKVMANVEELRRLCERPAPGARTAVEFNSDMGSWAGKTCIVQKRSGRISKGYALKLEGGSGRTFLFPFNALLLLSPSPSGPGGESDSDEDSDSS